jgi:hypothetical protein
MPLFPPETQIPTVGRAEPQDPQPEGCHGPIAAIPFKRLLIWFFNEPNVNPIDPIEWNFTTWHVGHGTRDVFGHCCSKNPGGLVVAGSVSAVTTDFAGDVPHTRWQGRYHTR